jgi:hypothetical protein
MQPRLALFVTTAVTTASLLIGCRPDLDARESRVTSTRVLATRGTPAEAAPGDDAKFEALVVGPQGTLLSGPIDWAFCTAPKPLSEQDDVSPSDCFVLNGPDIAPLGVGPSVAAKVPDNACRQFGPDVPETKNGEPPGRPADPDASGGYYQPVRLIMPSADADYVLALHEQRIRCGLAGAPPEVAAELKKTYIANTNPALGELRVNGTVNPRDDGMTPPMTLAVGSKITLDVAIPTCKVGEACGGVEVYPRYNPITRTLEPRAEVLQIGWFATDGTFDADRTASLENGFQLPSSAGDIHLWIVARDDRGGADYAAYRINVR